MAQKFSIVTTCKGRLHNLKRSLPGFLKQDDAEVIVVDYDCPDGTAAFVKRVHPDARLVSVANRPRFNTSHARNLGAAQARGEFLVFLDADVLVAGDFMRSVADRIRKGSFGQFGARARNSLRGCCVVGQKAFTAIGGYDELMDGYAGEDLDLYMRLKLAGAVPVVLAPDGVIEVIEQTTEERERHRSPNLKLQFLRGQLYSQAKEMVMSVQRRLILPPALRKKLADEVDRKLMALYAGEKDFTLEVALPDNLKRGFLAEWEFSRSITVKAKRKKRG